MNKIIITNVFWKYNAIGVATRKIADENEITITLKDKDGNLMYPNKYYVTSDELIKRKYKIENNNDGTELIYIPTKDLEDFKMTDEEKAISRVFGDFSDDPFDVEPDTRIPRNTGGYTKFKEGQTVRMRFDTDTLHRYYKFTPEGAIMPLQNNQARELLEEKTLDEIFADQTIRVSEGYCAVIWNYDNDQAEVWQFSPTTKEELQARNKDSDWVGGLKENDIKVTRIGKGKETKYTSAYAKENNELTAEMKAGMLNLPIEKMVAGATKVQKRQNND